jgi:hypothetical protein
MEFYQKLENTISWNKSVAEQSDALSQYDNISENDILELLKCVKYYEAGILIEYLGPEKLKDYLPQILEFLQDMNWPASGGASNMLRKSGRKILPEIRRVFSEVQYDEIWHYWILNNLIENWDQEIIEELKPDLIELIERADKEGASIKALSILKEEKLLTDSEVENYFQYLLKKYEGDDYWTNDLNEEIKPVANKT